MSKLTGGLALTVLMLILIMSSSCTAGYVSVVREAVSKIEVGAYDAAASTLEQVSSLDNTDPLGHKTLGIIYLHTNRLDQAEAEFRSVLTTLPNDWQSHYALGLIALVRNRLSDAEKHFSAAAEHPAARDELTALGLYRDLVAGGSDLQTVPPGSGNLLGRQIAAMMALKSGDSEDAASILSEMLRTPARPGFRENSGPLVTFDPGRPVKLPNGILNWSPAQTSEVPVVSGVIMLKAEISQTVGATYVTYYVDDVFAGVTNSWPFQFDWNTAHYPNGLYQVRIEAKSQWGSMLSQRSMWVRIDNPGSGHRSGPAVEELSRRLWNCIRVGESRALAHYHMAMLHIEEGNRDQAIEQLEYAVAYQADFLDARDVLNNLRGRKPVYSEVDRGRPGMKRIALTIDDGPNERTMDMLRVLAALDVRATFFIVGMQAELKPEIVRTIQAAGHQIENHTYTHPKLTTLTPDQVEAELSRTAAIIRAITGEQSVYFRPPGGHMNESTKTAAGRQGWTSVLWTINCSPHEGTNEHRFAQHVISNATDGGIVLMHNGEPVTVSALPKIVEELRGQGYNFVTVSEMLASSNTNRTR